MLYILRDFDDFDYFDEESAADDYEEVLKPSSETVKERVRQDRRGAKAANRQANNTPVVNESPGHQPRNNAPPRPSGPSDAQHKFDGQDRKFLLVIKL